MLYGLAARVAKVCKVWALAHTRLGGGCEYALLAALHKAERSGVTTGLKIPGVSHIQTLDTTPLRIADWRPCAAKRVGYWANAAFASWWV